MDPSTNKSKVVHRNFLLPVNFLPIGDLEDDSTVPSSYMERSKDIELTRRNLLLGIDEESEDRRTAVWVLHNKSPTVDENPQANMEDESESQLLGSEMDAENHTHDQLETGSDDADGTESSLESNSDHSQSEPDDSLMSSEVGPVSRSEQLRLGESASMGSVIDDVGLSGQSHGSVGAPTPERCAQDANPGPNRADSGSVDAPTPEQSALDATLGPHRADNSVVRTRYGRVIKPVKRLVEVMRIVVRRPEMSDIIDALLDVLVHIMDNNVDE